MKQLEVQIMGQSYLLGCPEDGDARLLDAVERVDTAMCKIRDSGKVRARDRIAVLAALNLAFDLADRGTAGVAASAIAAAAASSQVSAASSPDERRLAASISNGDEQLTALLERLDAALGEDGQLI